MSVVAVTGSSGFVGRAVLDRLAGGPHDAIALVRSDISAATCRQRPMPDLASLAKGETDIDLSGIEILVHCAALAQSVKNPTNVQRQHLSAVNAEATAVLAAAGADTVIEIKAGRGVFICADLHFKYIPVKAFAFVYNSNIRHNEARALLWQFFQSGGIQVLHACFVHNGKNGIVAHMVAIVKVLYAYRYLCLKSECCW